MFSKTKFHMIWLSLVGLLLSCGTYIGNPGESDPEVLPAEVEQANNTDEALKDKKLIIAVADSAIDELSEVNILVTSIAVRADGATEDDEGWIEMSLTQTSAINLLDYQGGDSLNLGFIDDLASGTYSEIRVVLDKSNPISAVDTTGASVAIRAPSASSSGIKIKGAFTIDGDQRKLVLDFDLRQSIRKTGQSYMFSPVIRLVDRAEDASISGSAGDSDYVCLYPEGYADEIDENCTGSEGSSRVTDGTYKIGHIPPGNYFLVAFDDDEDILRGEVFALAADDNLVIDISENGDADDGDDGDDDDDAEDDEEDD